MRGGPTRRVVPKSRPAGRGHDRLPSAPVAAHHPEIRAALGATVTWDTVDDVAALPASRQWVGARRARGSVATPEEGLDHHADGGGDDQQADQDEEELHPT